MATPDRGKTIFENLEEYPLPKKDGVRDYIFYLVESEATHGYGWSSRAFFRRWYRNHAENEVKSLESLIDVLHADLTQRLGRGLRGDVQA
jgi:hypothetical protein